MTLKKYVGNILNNFGPLNDRATSAVYMLIPLKIWQFEIHFQQITIDRNAMRTVPCWEWHMFWLIRISQYVIENIDLQ